MVLIRALQKDVKLKNMTYEELKAYDRQRQRECYARTKLNSPEKLRARWKLKSLRNKERRARLKAEAQGYPSSRGLGIG